MGQITKIIIGSLFIFNIGYAGSMGPMTQQQMDQSNAGSWVDDWWENVVEVQQAKRKPKGLEDIDTCTEKLERYENKVDIHPKSEYYLMKLNKWEKRCDPIDNEYIDELF